MFFGILWEAPLMLFLKSPSGFAEMHGYRVMEAAEILTRINRLKKAIIAQCACSHRPASEELDKLGEAFDRLWVVTGDKTIIQQKEEWQSGRALASFRY